MGPDLRPTIPTLRVLRALLDPPEGPHYGYDLMRRAALKSGSLYPIVSRLEQQGFITGSWEGIDAKAEGRPARREYRLTPAGIIRARVELQRAQDAIAPIGAARHA